MRRFYKTAAAVEQADGFAVLLDAKPVRTPAKQALAVSRRALAEAIAEEWRAQGEDILPRTLPLTRIASIALDLVAPRRQAVIDEVAKYAGTDLVCYRAEAPAELAARQQALWQPLVDWAALRFDAPLAVTTGILPMTQPIETLRAFAVAVAGYESEPLAALHLATGACGSLVIALALIEGRIDAAAAFAAAQLEESFEIERWGEDTEQTSKRAELRSEIALAERFVALLRG